MHNLINRRRTSRINELINALADKVPQLHEPSPAPLPGTKDGRSKAAVLQGARLTRPARVSPGESGGEGDGGIRKLATFHPDTIYPLTPPSHPTPHAQPPLTRQMCSPTWRCCSGTARTTASSYR